MWSESGRCSTATVLFTDMVASTEARVALGDEAADRLRRAHDRIVGHAVEAHHGRVVGSQGDGLVACFAAAADALSGAVAAQQALDRFNRSTPTPGRLDVRMGISSGDVAFLDGGDCSGLCVVEAGRLCAAARGGQILAAEVVRVLAGAGPLPGCVPLDPMALKGLPGPVPVVEVRWDPPPGLTVPIPDALLHTGTLPFAGRVREVEGLAGAWKEAAGGCQAVFVAGEPGIGKSRLLAQVAEVVRDQGGVVLYGRAHPDLGLPYSPFAEALRTYVTDCPPGELAAQLGPLGGDLARLVPRLGERVAGLDPPFEGDPETERYRLFEAVAGLLGGIGTPAPALLVLDDLHWADRATVTLLAHVLASGPGTRLLVAAGYRDTDVRAEHPLSDLMAAQHRRSDRGRLRLSGLSAREVAQIVTEVGVPNGPLDDELATAIHDQTDGNPFFVGEILRHLGDRRRSTAPRGDASARQLLAGLGVPEGVRQMVSLRLAALPPATRELLGCASVIGSEFDPVRLAAAAGTALEAVLSDLEPAEEARIVTSLPEPTGRYRFAHALVRSALYEGLARSRRSRLHRLVAETMSVRPGAGEVAEVARHFHSAGPVGPPGPATDAAVAAAEEATRSVSYEQAAVCYGMALDTLAWPGADTGRRGQCLLGRAGSWRRAGEPARTRDDLAAAAGVFRAAGDAEGLAAVALELGEVSDIWGDDPELVGLLEEVLAAGMPLALQARCRSRLAQALFYAGPDRRLSLSRRAVEEGRRAGDPGALGAVLCAHHVVLSGPDHLDERLATAGEIVELAATAAQPELALQGLGWRMTDRLQAGDRSGVEVDLADHADLAGRLRQPLALRDVEAWRAMGAILAGRFDDAGRHASAAGSLGVGAGDPHAAMMERVQHGWVAVSRARAEDLVWVKRLCLEEAGRNAGVPSFYGWSGGAAYAEALLGETAAAQARYGSCVGSVPGAERDAVWLSTCASFSLLAAQFGDEVNAGPLYEAMRPYAGQLIVIERGWVCRGAVDHYLGVLATLVGRLADAEAHLRSAVTVHEGLDAQPMLAASRLAQARVLLAAGDPGGGAALAGRALSGARALGMERLAAEAAGLLDRASAAGSGGPAS